MFIRRLAVAGLIAVAAAGAAAAQQNEVKGWITKPKAPEVVDPAPADPAENKPPRTISRGKNDPAPPQPDPIPVVIPQPQPQPDPVIVAPPRETLLATDPEAIQRVMLDAGYRAELTTDNNGYPLIISESSRSQFWVTFLDCDNPAGCLGVELYVGYTITSKPTADALNNFNASFRYVRAYVSGDIVAMAMDVLMQNDGIDPATFLEYMRLWTVILPEWETAMGV